MCCLLFKASDDRRGGSGRLPGGGGGGGVMAAAASRRPEEHLQPGHDRGARRTLPQRSDKRDEAARFGTSRLRRVLDHHRPVEAGVGEGRAGARQPGLAAGAQRYHVS